MSRPSSAMSKLLHFIGLRHYSAKVKVTLNEEVNQLLDNGMMKHRKHPGIVKPSTVELPKWVLQSIKRVLQEEPKASVKTLPKDGETLAKHLHGRHTPIEQDEVQHKVNKVEEILGIELTSDDMTVPQRRKANILLKQFIYKWQPIQYNKYRALSYVFGRAAQDFAVLHRIIGEIYENDKGFRPHTLLDFGSGIGTVLWAASHFWAESLRQYICIDASEDMHTLSEELCRNADPTIKTVYYRQFLPALPDPTADIVVSAYSLLELPNAKARLEVLRQLWNKTESYLIIVEHGTSTGFKVVNEARDFILNCSIDISRRVAHVFSPCPHDSSCPRYDTDDALCNFKVSYFALPYPQKSTHQTEHYSYVVLRKGKRPDNDKPWPRIVRPVLHRSNHTICRMCTASGDLREAIFTKSKHGRNLYACARRSAWGDRLPVRVEDVPKETLDTEVTLDKGNDNTVKITS